MVGWIVGSVQFTVSVLTVFVILTDPPISVSFNNIWSGCSVHVIWLLVIIFTSGVVNDSVGKLLRYALKWGVYTIKFLMIYFCLLTVCSILLPAFGPFTLLAVCSNLLIVSTILPAFLISFASFFCKESYNIPDNLPLSHVVSLAGLHYHYRW